MISESRSGWASFQKQQAIAAPPQLTPVSDPNYPVEGDASPRGQPELVEPGSPLRDRPARKRQYRSGG
jgi:hypothetical protein